MFATGLLAGVAFLVMEGVLKRFVKGFNDPTPPFRHFAGIMSGAFCFVCCGKMVRVAIEICWGLLDVVKNHESHEMIFGKEVVAKVLLGVVILM